MAQQNDPGSNDEVHEAVRRQYAAAAQASGRSADASSGCCGDSKSNPLRLSAPITADHYCDETGDALQGALAASLGCGNPTALIDLSPGQDVLDLGSGGGIDVLLSARRVAPGGVAYGLDMTDDMLALAEKNQADAGIENATFLKGQIENVPLPDGSVDVVISNCVINLSPDKDAVLSEAYRVLRPGGRFAVSDIVALREIPAALRGVVALWTGCVSGAMRDTEYVGKLQAAGFDDPSVQVTREYSRDELQGMAEHVDPATLPEGFDVPSLVDALDGAFASAFVRATRRVA